MSELDRTGDELPLLPDDLEIYRIIAEGGDLPSGQNVDRLVALRLVDPDPYRPGKYVPHDPRAVAKALTAAALRDLSQLTDRMSHIPALERLAEHFDPHRLYGGPSSEYLATAEQMNARLGETTTAAATEIITLQPSEPADRDPAILRLGIERTRAALARGILVRSLYHRSAYEHPQTQQYVGQMAADGADVRASGAPGPRMVIIDGRHLFIDNHVLEDAEPNSGWHVFDRSAVAWARAVFHHFWDQATRWQDLSKPADRRALTERQQRILRELDAGYSQQQVGPRIGLSERAVAKELAAIREGLGLRSTYQVMAWWGRASTVESS
ncbi:hypothetical protein RM704_10710 [Streptomyces sp. DSM 3412]|uniref:HTH luxR-type domain-containing protein n=1 Tax=Streptomyces gottesmaniae TaxID=3075518 RepID=A0ABU2YVD0_9ACTN|nr:hypothetical protein [Streptomyces sp. DSM 3412]MDT0567936.1 hypothetical protein [Streptomyces sp. DSM 3412]